MRSSPFNILISSAGRRVALLRIFQRTLGDLGLEGRVMAADMSRFASAFHRADQAFEVPPCSAPDFVDRMLDICREHEVRLLVPTIDPELVVYAAHRDAFEALGVRVHVSAPAVIHIGSNKEETHRWLSQQGLPTVGQTTVETARANPRQWPFPLLVKPIAGSASMGVAIVHNTNELSVASAGSDCIVQTIAPGDEYTVSVLVSRQGRSVCAVPRKRLRVRGGEVEKAVTARIAPVEELAVRMCDQLPGGYGAMNVQIFYDSASGELNIIELNPRFGGGFPLAWEAGAHYPRWILEELLGLPSAACADQWQDGLVMLRYDDAVFVPAVRAGL